MFRSIVDAGSGWGITLAVIAAVNSVIAFFYYFRVVTEMWFRPVASDDERPIRMPQPLVVAIAITSALVLVVGVFPQIFGRVGDAAF
jgi:NADH-quinone oxidoreductase subunit N